MRQTGLPLLGIQYSAHSFKSHPIARELRAQLIDFCKDLVARDAHYTMGEAKLQFWLHYNGASRMVCFWDNDKHDYDANVFVINISGQDLHLPILADEAAYGGRFPASVTASGKPQVWELRGKGITPDSYERFNGIFEDGYLVKGSRTFHGYGPFYDGVWYSDEWPNPIFYKNYDVIFRPEGTGDTIRGRFTHGDMSSLTLGPGYYEHHGTADAGEDKRIPAWVRTTFTPYEALYAARAKREQTGYSGGSYTAPANNSAGAAKKDFWTTCSCCHGLGYTEQYNRGTTYQIKDRYGNNTGTTGSQRTTCSCCHGTGK